jgi:hypothetical protein
MSVGKSVGGPACKRNVRLSDNDEREYFRIVLDDNIDRIEGDLSPAFESFSVSIKIGRRTTELIEICFFSSTNKCAHVSQCIVYLSVDY